MVRARLGEIPLQGGELLRLLLNDPQGILPELLNEQPGGGLPTPFTAPEAR